MTSQRGIFINWVLFIALCVIWGSSFILMKEGLKALTAYQVAAVRMFSAGIVLLPIAIRQLKKIPRGKMSYFILSGLLGSFFPAFLFCVSETRIDSSLAGFLNALTPVFTIVCGILFFKSRIPQQKIAGILIALIGMVFLLLAQGTVDLTYFSYASLSLIAALSYGVNINLVNRYLKEVGSTNIAAISFSILLIPSLIVLWITGYFQLPLLHTDVLLATGASSVLGIFGSAIATILFYVLLKRGGVVFSSTVPYGIPFVAMLWGVLAGESINLWQIVGLMIVLAGVYLTNRNTKQIK